MKKHDLEKIIASYYLTDKVTVLVSDVTKYDDSRVEIRQADTGFLIWRAWDFEENFIEDLDKNLKPFSIPA
ncbi:hypothetical protein [Pantoea sp. CFSAN033090]|uniref:hypothetical protein n=1 Tax=Pantoea sp. CFSAN033090 TaxID=1690502 RepID=UPI00068FC8C8|nr:hypothetical protein [Pantoea sp. CFSAN033090]KOA68697.1 hypothetical protein AFL22_19815 [Pantoea sp. CFSAN033090]